MTHGTMTTEALFREAIRQWDQLLTDEEKGDWRPTESQRVAVVFQRNHDTLRIVSRSESHRLLAERYRAAAEYLRKRAVR